MLEIIIAIVGAGSTVIFGFLAVIKRVIPGVIEVFVKRIEYAYKRELVQLESVLEVHTTSLTNSMEIASQIGDKYREKTIESAELLWNDILHIQRTFASLSAIMSILTKDEIIEAIKNPDNSKRTVREALFEFNPKGKIEEIFCPRQDKNLPKYSAVDLSITSGTFPDYLNETRPFVSEDVFALHSAHRFVFGRLALLVRSGMQSGEPVYWMDDPLMNETISAVWAFMDQKWEDIEESDKPNFRSLVLQLNLLFINEAKKCIRGTDNLAESINEINQIFRKEEVRSQFERDLFNDDL
ncbi:MAG: hypothetical protein OXE59_10215 [Bacteroidetes bacterium]|nr:hypothetical protein [Bacteroidota bacterium]